MFNRMLNRTDLADDAYIYVKMPKLYWIAILTFPGMAILAVLLSAVVNAAFGYEWLGIQDGWTPFYVGMVAALLLALTGAWLFIIGFIVFPKSIRSRNDSSFKRLWPPWED